MRLHIRNRSIKVVDCTTKEESWLDELLAVKVPGAKYMPSYQQGRWDGMHHVFNNTLYSFPAGLLPLIVRENDERKRPFEVRITDKRRAYPESEIPLLSTEEWVNRLEERGFKPDPRRCKYQVECINQVLSNRFRSFPWLRGIVQLPTGSGKTLLSAGFVWSLDVPRTLVLVDRLDLLLQTKEVYEQVLKRRVGVLGGGHRQLARVVIATVQTLGARLGLENPDEEISDWVKRVRVLIVDECHKVGDNAHSTVINRINAPVRIGLSATPLARGDVGDLLLVGVTGDVLYSLRADALAADGLLATPLVELIPIDKPAVTVPPPPRTFNNWKRRQYLSAHYRKVYKLGITENQNRNMTIAYRAKDEVGRGNPTLILVKYIKHGHTIRECLESLGLDAVFLKGDDPVDRRRELVKKFKQGEVPVLIASTIFDEAVDIPNIRALILAGGGNSPIKAIQRVGRGMRVKEGENVLVVVDFLDLTHRSLREHSLRRAEIYESQGYRIKE